jgi:hypothetical protein
MPSLHWSSKKEAIKAAPAVPHRPLLAEPSLDHGDPAAENLLIQGDNPFGTGSEVPNRATEEPRQEGHDH